MSRFAQLVQAQERRKEESQKTTISDSQLSTLPPDALATIPASSHLDNIPIQIPTEMASHLPANLDSQHPPTSLITTSDPKRASRQASKRMVDSRRLRRADSRKGDRHRGDKVPFNNRLTEATINRIKHFCVDHDLEQQEFAELAAIHFMDAVESHQSSDPDSMQSHDDRELMIMFKTTPSIINLYLQYNPVNRWKPADDYEGLRYNDKDIRIIEIGIIQTQFNARFKKINSFKYYTTEIDLALETPLVSETIDIMLKQGRRRWAEASGKGS